MGLGYLQLSRRRHRPIIVRRRHPRLYALGGASAAYDITGDVTLILDVASTVLSSVNTSGSYVRAIARGTDIRIR